MNREQIKEMLSEVIENIDHDIWKELFIDQHSNAKEQDAKLSDEQWKYLLEEEEERRVYLDTLVSIAERHIE